MRRINLFVFTALLALLLASCSSVNEVEKLKAEVMEVHDEVMPEMGNLMNLKKQLKDKIAYPDSIGGSAEELDRLIHNLEAADESMMEWMRNYKDPSPEMSEEEALKYLQNKMESIREVKQKINSSKAAAEAVLNQ
ncbi:viral A-type inclusion protein [Marinoscillum luteum]|uniref:Viral A-type inclusion protein n=1 Tax=Marinoscillum luteum TaxID=861051 RepID=A0ABW7NA56_9BACT